MSVVTMAQQSYATVISSQFVMPYAVNVTVDKYSSGYLVIRDEYRNTLFTIRSCDTNFHTQRLLQDAYGSSIAMLRAKIRTAHARWNVFRVHGEANSDMIFSAARNQMHPSQSPESFMVRIYPHVDNAFVVAIIVIVDAMKTPGTTAVVAGNFVQGAVWGATHSFG
ncbi:hypothetical protein L1987_46869 [Smallanthus sonchifolius]|uniref:Uncharacterized protein n=1 Tax=Smallanthus sonchifolius TaxID=185202 RepID=A0ACB9G119_9ASTR|nr:hypothetical protein L1987_46869 [Smallanthus sonchifolius]